MLSVSGVILSVTRLATSAESACEGKTEEGARAWTAGRARVRQAMASTAGRCRQVVNRYPATGELTGAGGRARVCPHHHAAIKAGCHDGCAHRHGLQRRRRGGGGGSAVWGGRPAMARCDRASMMDVRPPGAASCLDKPAARRPPAEGRVKCRPSCHPFSGSLPDRLSSLLAGWKRWWRGEGSLLAVDALSGAAGGDQKTI